MSLLNSGSAISAIYNRVRTYAGSLSLSGAFTRLLNTVRSVLSGTLSLAGDISHFRPYQTYVSILSFIGGLTRVLKSIRTKVGSINFSGTLTSNLPTFSRAISASLSFAGSIASSLSRVPVYAGSATFSGIVSYLIAQLYTETRSGIVSFVGSIIHAFSFNKTITGTLLESPTEFEFEKDGDFAFEDDGAFTWGGSIGLLSRWINMIRTKAGTLNISGAYSRIVVPTVNTFGGTLSFIGSTSRKAALRLSRTVSGTLNLQGAISSSTSLLEMLTGAVSGVLVILRTYSGTLSFSGSVYVDNFKTLLADLSFSATAYSLYLIYRTKTASISFVGTVSNIYQFIRTYTGTLSFSGDYSYIQGVRSKTKAGVLSLAGAFTRIAQTSYSAVGTLNLSGTITRIFAITKTTYAGILSFAGSVGSLVVGVDVRQGSVGLGGTIQRVIQVTKSYSGSITPAGAFTRLLALNRTKARELALAHAIESWKEAMYYGVINP